ncbi:MAG: hypothetical protein KDA58_04885 [Planctomycetaceae bacterium]|nr:hypothetical protein [Planctomycetaceae bacterium]
MLTSSLPASLAIDSDSRHIKRAVHELMRGQVQAVEAISGQLVPRRRRSVLSNRRSMDRWHVKIPVQLWAAEWHGKQLCMATDEPVLGLVRDLSYRGLGLAYDARLDSDLMIAEFDLFGEGPLQLLTELRWVRKRGEHDYLGGGLFQGLIRG